MSSSSSSSPPPNSSSNSNSNSNSDPSPYLHLPDECWESVFKHLQHNPIYLETLSLVSTQFLSITNRIRSSLSITKQCLPFLNSLFFRFQNLTSLSFRHFHGDLNAILQLIAPSELPELESLDLSYQLLFPSKGLRRFSRKFPTLKSLKCSKMRNLINADLVVIAKCFPDLQELDISYLSDCNADSIIFNNYNDLNDPVSSFGVIALVSGLKKLIKLNLTGNHFLCDDSILSICGNCEFLEELAFEGDALSRNVVATAIRTTPRLSSLRVTGLDHELEILRLDFADALLSLEGLTSVDLSRSMIPNEVLCAIAEAGLPLRKLVLEGCWNFSYRGISCLLRKCGPFLQHLNLKNIKFLSDERVAELSLFLGGLISVNLSGNFRITDSSFFHIVRNCRLITEILMESTGVGKQKVEEDSLIGLVESSNAKSLFLSHNSWLNDDSVRMFASVCPNLEWLDLYHSRGVSNGGVVEVLKRCCKIRHLNLHFSGLKSLQIDFQVPSLFLLDLKWLEIGDETLSAIAKSCHRLLHLELEGCQNITAKGVKEVIDNCKQLKIINLKGCDKVAAHVVNWMVFARPSLRKIVTPPQFRHTERQRELYERHGCLVS